MVNIVYHRETEKDDPSGASFCSFEAYISVSFADLYVAVPGFEPDGRATAVDLSRRVNSIIGGVNAEWKIRSNPAGLPFKSTGANLRIDCA